MLSFLLTFLFFYTTPDHTPPPYFEGEIVYEQTFVPHEEYPHISAKDIAEKIGSRYLLKYKKGFQKREYYSPSGQLLTVRYLDLQANRSYHRYIGKDTVYYYDVGINDSKTTFTPPKDTILEQHPCKVIHAIARINEPQSSYTIPYTTYYATDLPVNPKWFEHYREGDFDKVIQLAKGIMIQTYTHELYWKRQVNAKAIKWRKVHPKEIQFELQPGEVLVEF